MPKILHFADAHIDMANYGRHDSETGLPLRVLDFLKSLDAIVDAAVEEKVDLVIFAGDAYKDRTPAPTFQREWGKRMMRLSRAGIPTLLLVGNHDLSPAVGRATSLQEFETLDIPHVRVLSKPCLLGPDDLEGLPLQIIALPWINRSTLLADQKLIDGDPKEIYTQVEGRLTELVNIWLDGLNPDLPVVLTAHGSVQGAVYGGERMVMLGSDVVYPRSLVCDPRLDYVALGHIHKPQNLNDGRYPPVIYPGSIERVDFGECKESRFFIVADVHREKTTFEWRELKGVRPFIDIPISLPSPDDVSERLRHALEPRERLAGAIVRLTVEYPRDWETLLDETALRDFASEAFEFHLVKKPQTETRIRLPQDQAISSLSPLDLLEKFWLSNHADPDEIKSLKDLARDVISEEQMPTL